MYMKEVTWLTTEPNFLMRRHLPIHLVWAIWWEKAIRYTLIPMLRTNFLLPTRKVVKSLSSLATSVVCTWGSLIPWPGLIVVYITSTQRMLRDTLHSRLKRQEQLGNCITIWICLRSQVLRLGSKKTWQQMSRSLMNMSILHNRSSKRMCRPAKASKQLTGLLCYQQKI